MGRFIIKHIYNTKPQMKPTFSTPPIPVEKDEGSEVVKEENKEIKENKSVMTTAEKIELANEVLGTKPAARRIKRDRGLIERTESSKTILTEDNKELLND